VSTPTPEKGVPVHVRVSLKDAEMMRIVSDHRVLEILQSVYGTLPYLRNDPHIHRSEIGAPNQMDGNYYFHVDRYQQISLMVLMSEVTESTTHMLYAEGTNKRIFGFLDLRMQYLKAKTNLPEKFRDRQIIKLIGKPGDAFLFDSMGLHRANYISGTTRDVIFVNYTNGHNLYPYRAAINPIDQSNPFQETFNRKSSQAVFVKGTLKSYFKSDFLNRYC
jgi:hypothetical protein